MATNNTLQPGGQVIMKIQGLDFSYGTKQVLHKISLDIKAGRLIGLLGPNGSGKSTLFRCCLGFLPVQAGKIFFGGKPIESFGTKRLASELAYVPQEHRPAFPFTVREMVSMGRTPHMGRQPILSARDRLVVASSLQDVGISHLASENYNHLSGGQRQMVLVARALAQETSLIFLDEPTSSLDFRNQIRIWQTIRKVVNTGYGAVICCHDPNHILWFCDEATIVKDGRVLATGDAREVVTEPILEELYGKEVAKTTADNKPFIYPRSIMESSFARSDDIAVKGV
ncbi:MAG: ABC transporter ATP-binding protein [Deltaproteobacteria bacterium]|jgi:iron complex transport system ATP-binding protein|nr:ABC transporter ATP-binding protein [Deltaproteobacteria bacterium]